MKELIVLLKHWNPFIPDELKQFLLEKEKTIKHMDLGTEQLFDFPNARTVKAEVSRFVVDVNRRRDDFSKQGVFILEAWHGEKNWDREELNKKGNAEKLLQKYYDPFHKEVNEILGNAEKDNKELLIIDGHAMDSKGGSSSKDPGRKRPDFDIATNGFNLCRKETAEKLKKNLEKLDYEVSFDRPYDAAVNPLNGKVKPGKIDAIELEVNKKLYMDESKQELIPEKVEKVNKDLREAIFQLLY